MTGKELSRLPGPLLPDSRLKLFDIEYLYTFVDGSRETDTEDSIDRLFGFRLPPFQRPLVWDEEKMVRFVESVVLGLDIGKWVLNDNTNECQSHPDGTLVFPETHNWVIDGQQRLTALSEFFKGSFRIFVDNGEGGFAWEDFSPRERIRFLTTSFPVQALNETDPNILHELYDRMNYGGVAHDLADRIVPEAVEYPTNARFR